MSNNALNFSADVQKLLRDYAADCFDEAAAAVDEVRKEAVKDLRSASKSTFGGSGAYAGHWSSKMEKTRLNASAVVFGGDPTYRLAHLLEYGHVSRNGTGRSYGRVPGREHIAPVAEKASKDLEARIMSRLEGMK